MNPSLVSILLLLTLTCCSDEPKAQHPGASTPPPSISTPLPPTGRETAQPQVVPPPERKPSFDIKLQRLQEQVDWVNRRIGQ